MVNTFAKLRRERKGVGLLAYRAGVADESAHARDRVPQEDLPHDRGRLSGISCGAGDGAELNQLGNFRMSAGTTREICCPEGAIDWDARGMTIMFIICTLAGIGLSKRRYR